jgi:hypothetical protein
MGRQKTYIHRHQWLEEKFPKCSGVIPNRIAIIGGEPASNACQRTCAGSKRRRRELFAALFGSLLIGADTKYHTLMLDLGARGDRVFTSTLWG